MANKGTSIVMALGLLFVSCSGGDGGGLGAINSSSGSTSNSSRTLSDIDVCGLLSPVELTEVLGEAPTPKESEPSGPFTGCSWGTGDVLVSIALTNSLILAPGETECPSADIGEESYACEDRVKFLVNGTHVSVTTINAFVTDAHLHALAEVVHLKLST